MIVIKGKEVSAIRLGEKVISAVYKGAVLVWQAVSNIWLGKDVWKGNDLW